jgi:hypothetical protein
MVQAIEASARLIQNIAVKLYPKQLYGDPPRDILEAPLTDRANNQEPLQGSNCHTKNISTTSTISTTHKSNSKSAIHRVSILKIFLPNPSGPIPY